ncbi:MAG: DUF2141 domain-containing protein [Candidatus Omnitrophica bacterium]|nr:DUF2141 domain-containing protein [Candidatus Omnitrophota bacterium]
MTRRILSVLFYVFLFALGLSAQPIAETGKIKVLVRGLRNDKGFVKIGLYNTKSGYYSRGQIASFRSAQVAPKEKKAEYIFDRVPYGEYTVKLFHDENPNGRLDKNIFGIPTEKYGFSNSPKAFFRLPDYNQAKFNLSSNQITLEIKVQ